MPWYWSSGINCVKFMNCEVMCSIPTKLTKGRRLYHPASPSQTCDNIYFLFDHVLNALFISYINILWNIRVSGFISNSFCDHSPSHNVIIVLP